MDNALQFFKNEEFGKIRTINKDNVIWFVGKDVANILGYRETANMRKILERAEYIEINPQSQQYQGFVQNGLTLEPNKNIFRMLLINESGLYNAIFNSTLPNAKRFKRWVTSEVLPSIRKHGMYATPQTAADIIANPDTMIEILIALKKEREQRIESEAKAKHLAQKVEKDKPKVDFADRLLRNDKHAILVRDMAKIITQNGYKIGQNQLYDYLRAHKYLLSGCSSDRNMPTQRYINSGLFVIHTGFRPTTDDKEEPYRQTRITTKGQKYFLEQFMLLKQLKEQVKERRSC